MTSVPDTKPSYIKAQFPLAPHTTLGAGGNAEYYADITSIEMLQEAVAWAKGKGLSITPFGDGSNVLVSDSGVKGLVLHLCVSDMSFNKNNGTTLAEVGAGVLLDTFIAESVARGLWGIENLSGIPGTVGASPVQNVGAYGVEVKDAITAVRVYDVDSEKSFEIQNTECIFAYRDSIFKKEEGKNYIITHVTFALSEKESPRITYKDLQDYFGDNVSPTLIDIRNAVIDIRSKKFPDYTRVGTAGSFFKNPIISETAFAELLSTYPDIPGYPVEKGQVKIALGWILDHVCHLKGYAEGDVRLFEKQALVLVCARGIKAEEIETFSEKIISRIFEKTNILVEREVTIFK